MLFESSFSSSTLQPVVAILVALYLLVEIGFYAIFHLYLVPAANQRTKPQPYHDYGNQRHRLLVRIMKRIRITCEHTGRDFSTEARRFLQDWFARIDVAGTTTNSSHQTAVKQQQQLTSGKEQSSSDPHSSLPHLLHTESSMSSTASSEDSVESTTEEDEKDDSESAALVGVEEMNELIAWALFETVPSAFTEWETEELKVVYQILWHEIGLSYPPGRLGQYKCRRLSIDPVSVLHRPLLVYLIVLATKFFMGWFLRCVGFQRAVSKTTGLVGWYRPARDAATDAALLPLVFFHGLAPAGFFFYIPMVLHGFLKDGRAAFLFENPNISCQLGFQALDEVESVQGIAEIVDQFLAPNRGVALCGHSFGSVPITWLLRSNTFRNRIQQMVLLDPVTIMLSECDVMVNFLYSQKTGGVRLVAGSELFTVYYLRRKFSWYNSELWIEAIPDSIQVTVALSERDEIVNAPRVLEHLQIFGHDNIKVIYWKEAPHASCVTSVAKWREIKTAMVQQEGQLQLSTTATRLKQE